MCVIASYTCPDEHPLILRDHHRVTVCFRRDINMRICLRFIDLLRHILTVPFRFHLHLNSTRYAVCGQGRAQRPAADEGLPAHQQPDASHFRHGPAANRRAITPFAVRTIVRPGGNQPRAILHSQRRLPPDLRLGCRCFPRWRGAPHETKFRNSMLNSGLYSNCMS